MQGKSSNTLWFFWGPNELSYLRYMTLLSASLIHDDITLVLRKHPVSLMTKFWERQECEIFIAERSTYLCLNQDKKKLPANIKIKYLEDVAPEIAALKAHDVHTSDLLSWYLLANYGGTVADMDIVFLKPLPEIKEDVQVVVFANQPKEGYMPVTFMQGRPCLEWEDIYRRARDAYDPDIYECCGASVIETPPTGNLSEHVVFPWAGKHKIRHWHGWLFRLKRWPTIPDDCIGLHWYAGRNQEWNQKIRSEADLKLGAVSWACRKVLENASISS